MTPGQIAGALCAAVLLFWAVGAYNRLVRLRGAIVRQFVPVEEQLRLRHGLLLEWVSMLEPALTNAGPRLDALRAACQQVATTCARAKLHPGSTGAIGNLRLADAILGEARARLPVPSAPGSELAELYAQLQACDVALSFARRQFNDAVDRYSHAVAQFPTLLLTGLFGFRSAAPL